MQRFLEKSDVLYSAIDEKRIARLPLGIHSRVEQPDRHTCVEFLPVSQIGHGIEIRCVECGHTASDVDESADTLIERADLQDILLVQTKTRRRWVVRRVTSDRIERSTPNQEHPFILSATRGERKKFYRLIVGIEPNGRD